MSRSWVWERAAVTGVGICLALSTVSCGKLLKKKSDPAPGTASSATSTTDQDLADQQMGFKLEEYIKCLNKVGEKIYRAKDRYQALFPNGPSGKELSADIPRVPSGMTTTCSNGVARSRTMQPADARLESAGTEYAAAAQNAEHVIAQVGTYFDQRTFREDKWARGKALHPQLTAAFKRFGAADHSLHQAVDAITKPLAQRELARLEREDGRKFKYGRRNVLITARRLIETADPVGEDRNIDFALLNSAYIDFEKALEELTLYGSLHRADLSNPALSSTAAADANFTAFTHEANDFKKAATDWWQCLRGAPASSKDRVTGKIERSKIGRCADGSLASARNEETIKQYNDFINTSNGQPFP